ncbi:MAG: DUF1307 domain-containing protein [Eubacterium sp.]|nr:DUF1307 domain-containing protein [Eubacterium sp.]
MKKFLCVMLACIMVLAMAACGSPNSEPVAETKVMNISVDGVVIEYKMDAVDDIIQTLTQTSTLDKAMFAEDEVAAFEASFEQYEAIYAEIEGVTYETQSTDTELIEIITMDVSNSDTIKTLADSGLLPVDGSTKRLSLSGTVEGLQEQGWVLQE